MYYIKGNVVTNGELLEDRFVEITGEKITYVGKGKPNKDTAVYVLENGYICPGFVDVHIHGVDGFDFMDRGTESFRNISNRLLKYGVTSFLATSRTAAMEDIMAFLESAKMHASEEGSKMLGVHLEGPWISARYRGAQSEEHIRLLSWDDVENVIKPFLAKIKRITLAPEEVGEFSILEYLSSHGINVSAGHTNATIEEISHAMEYGLRQTTHTFNAMSPLHHRQPGTAAAALQFDELICEIITDGVHVHSQMIELLYKMKGKERTALISDCTGYNELPNGKYDLRGKKLIREGNRVTLASGTLAGSAITLDKGLKYAIEHCTIPLEEAVFMATETPLSTVNGKHDIGKVEAGYLADLVVLDGNYHVSKTILNGKTVYSKGGKVNGDS